MIVKIKNLIKTILKFYKDELDLAFSEDNDFFYKLLTISLLFLFIPLMAFFICFLVCFIIYMGYQAIIFILAISGALAGMTCLADRYYKRRRKY